MTPRNRQPKRSRAIGEDRQLPVHGGHAGDPRRRSCDRRDPRTRRRAGCDRSQTTPRPRALEDPWVHQTPARGDLGLAGDGHRRRWDCCRSPGRHRARPTTLDPLRRADQLGPRPNRAAVTRPRGAPFGESRRRDPRARCSRDTGCSRALRGVTDPLARLGGSTHQASPAEVTGLDDNEVRPPNQRSRDRGVAN